MNNRRFFSIAILLLIIINQAKAQKSIELLSRAMPDSIMLRWAPSDSKTWRLANNYGYKLIRYTLLRDKKILKEIEELELVDSVLKPAPLYKWEPFAHKKYVGIAAECIYSSFYEGIPSGGNPHIVYKKYKEEQQRYSFALYAADQSIKAAELSGLYFADKTVKPNEKYLYKVYVNCPDSLAVDTASIFTGQSTYKQLPKPIDLQAKWQDKKVGLTWNIKYLSHIYNSYIIEKSIDNGATYHQLGDNAIVQVSDVGVEPYFAYKSDSLPDNKSIFHYRIRGVNAFGQMGPASDSIFGTGRLPIEIAPVITSNELVDNKRVDLFWEYPQDMNEYISGFKIYRSSSPKGKKALILNGTDRFQRSFMDTTPHMTNYYRISVYNDQTEKLTSLLTYVARVDSFPPLKPSGGIGTIDSTGIVTLTWDANTEDDLNGYRVYVSNNPNYEFILAGDKVLKETSFLDTISIKTLTKQIYYKVKAEDVRQNQSPFSELITLERPDVIAPVAPLLKAIENSNGKPKLKWVNSSSDDAIQHLIYRKVVGDSVYIALDSLVFDGDIISSYLDKKVAAGTTYIYKLKAQDDSGLLSASSQTMQFKVASDITEELKLKKRVYADRVKLLWTIKSEKDIKRIVVYRAVNQGVLQLYGNTDSDQYIDKKLSPGKTYRYAIKAIYADDSSSQLSKSIIVKF
ncbi:fibronectin type III domain-containing protein [Saccharicrinis aurantiacus]|uniref:fibronectin type III domain-containing protein n=1 Tax=Saccharicrinis aurantiacus TaxID=1849719 RepID=UPI0009500DF8|nr:hypothetical protein [Saccharicrinis aurantiacus]